MARTPERRQLVEQTSIQELHHFPWLMEPTAEKGRLSDNQKPRINPAYANSIDEEAYARVYGEIRTIEDLSYNSAACVSYLQHIYRDLIEQPFIESGGEDITINPETTKLLNEYLASLRERIPIKHEYNYVIRQVEEMQAHFESLAALLIEAWLMGKTVPKHIAGFGTTEYADPID